MVDWLRGLDEKARNRCLSQLARLRTFGHELRRPAAENLGLGLYELRVKAQGLNLRMLYFFHGNRAVVVTQGFTKQQREVPGSEIQIALDRKAVFEADPATHSTPRGI